MTAEYGTHLIKPYEGAGAAFAGIWKRWHTWEWSPENTCRVEDILDAREPFREQGDSKLEKAFLRALLTLKKSLATPDLEVGPIKSMERGWGSIGSMELLEVEYGSNGIDYDYEAAQEFIAEFESKLLAWCRSIDGAPAGDAVSVPTTAREIVANSKRLARANSVVRESMLANDGREAELRAELHKVMEETKGRTRWAPIQGGK